jgi:t-SNARE complex subunit (syntaxin)
MQQQRSGQARAVLAEVQNRHDDMKKIEKTIIVSILVVECQALSVTGLLMFAGYYF